MVGCFSRGRGYWLLAALLVLGCGDGTLVVSNGSSGDSPGFVDDEDNTHQEPGPGIHVTSPQPGELVTTSLVPVRGTCGGANAVTVNGTTTDVIDGVFDIAIPVDEQDQVIAVEAASLGA